VLNAKVNSSSFYNIKDNFYHLIIITEVLKGYTTLTTKIIVVKIIRNIK